MGDGSKAEEKFKKAIEIDRRIGHVTNHSKHCIHYGEYLLNNNIKLAHEIFNENFAFVFGALPETTRSYLSEEDLLVSQQYAYYGMGLNIKVKNKDANSALAFFASALETGNVLDHYVQMECLRHMSSLLDKEKLVPGLSSKLRALISSFMEEGERDIIFLLDYSRSMRGARIKAAVENMKSLFNDYVYLQDNVALFTFSNTEKRIFPLQPKNERYMLPLFDEQDSPEGGTALYGAISAGLDELQLSYQLDGVRQKFQWLVVVTDGEDNRSDITLHGKYSTR